MDNPTIFDKILAVASFEELSDRGSLQAGRSILGVIKVIQELCLKATVTGLCSTAESTGSSRWIMFTHIFSGVGR